MALPNADSSVLRDLSARVHVLLSYPVGRGDCRAQAYEIISELSVLPAGAEVDVVRCFAESRVAACLRIDGDLQGAFRVMMGCLRTADQLDHVDLQATMWSELALIHSTTGRLREARHWLERALASKTSPQYRARIRASLASNLRASGRIEEADVVFDEVIADVNALPEALRSSAHINAASAWWQVGKCDKAEASLIVANDLLLEHPEPLVQEWVPAIGAWVCAAGGDAEEGLRRAREALSCEPQVEVASSASRAFAKIASEHLQLGVCQEAQRAMESTLRRAERKGMLSVEHDLHASLAALCSVQGDLVGTVRHLQREKLLNSQLQDQAQQMTLRFDDLRMEVARVQCEANALRAHRERLADANRALIAADQARTRLLRMVAHDLRSPLTGIVLSLDLFRVGGEDERREYLKLIQIAALKMVGLLDSALSNSGIESGEAEVTLEVVDVVQVARSTVRSFWVLAANKDQSIELLGDDAISAWLDAVSLGRVLDNLVSNAIKFTPRGGSIEVRVSSDEGQIDLVVSDSGPGFVVEDDMRGALLGQRLTARATEGEQGWGIGLHTVYSLVARLGGVVSLRNGEKGGAVARVTLPIHRSSDFPSQIASGA